VLALSRIAAALLTAGCLLGGCAQDDSWLTARLADDRLTLEIGGQCDPDSYLSRLRVATTDARVLWEVAQERPPQPTPTVTLGSVPTGFHEETPAAAAGGTIVVFLDTSVSFVATIDLDALRDGHERQYTPRPVWNELTPVAGARC
jgi:hypothetical protein